MSMSKPSLEINLLQPAPSTTDGSKSAPCSPRRMASPRTRRILQLMEVAASSDDEPSSATASPHVTRAASALTPSPPASPPTTSSTLDPLSSTLQQLTRPSSAVMFAPKKPSHRRAKSAAPSPSPSSASSRASTTLLPASSVAKETKDTASTRRRKKRVGASKSSSTRENKRGSLSEEPLWFKTVVRYAKRVFAARTRDSGAAGGSDKLEARFVRRFVESNSNATQALSVAGYHLGPLAVHEVCAFVAHVREHGQELDGRRIVSLDVSNNPLGDEGMEKLAEFLASDASSELESLRVSSVGATPRGLASLFAALAGGGGKSLTTLRLGSKAGKQASYMGEEAAAHLAEWLKGPSVASFLSLSNCGLGQLDSGVGAIAAALAANSSLRDLNLARNRLHYMDIRTLAGVVVASGSNLDSLSLEQNLLGCAGAAEVAEMLHSHAFTSLDLGSNHISVSGLCLLTDAVAESPALAKLVLDNNSMAAPPDHISVPVDKKDKRKKLVIDTEKRERVRAKMAEHKLDGLKVSPRLHLSKSLRELSLNQCSIDDALMNELAHSLHKNRSLRVLLLNGNHLACGKALAEIVTDSRLCRLEVQFNHLPEEAGVLLAQAAAKSTWFKEISLAQNELGDDSGRAWTGVLRSGIVTECDLTGNHISHVVLAKVKKLATRNKRKVEAKEKQEGLKQMRTLKEKQLELRLVEEERHPVLAVTAVHHEVLEAAVEELTVTQEEETEVTQAFGLRLNAEAIKRAHKQRHIDATLAGLAAEKREFALKARDVRAQISQERRQRAVWLREYKATMALLQSKKDDRMIGLDDVSREEIVFRKAEQRRDEAKDELGEVLAEVQRFVEELEGKAKAEPSAGSRGDG